MNKHQAVGRLRESAGKASELAGRMLGLIGLQAAGRAEQILGRSLIDRGDRQEVFRRVSEAQI